MQEADQGVRIDEAAIARLYKEFLTDGPCGHTAHHLLHTHYTPRGKYIA